MKKQYLPQVQYKGFPSGEWHRVMNADFNGGKRYADSLEEAQQAIERMRKYWREEREGKHRKQRCGAIGIDVAPVTDDTFEIVATRIRVREVSEWQTVE